MKSNKHRIPKSTKTIKESTLKPEQGSHGEYYRVREKMTSRHVDEATLQRLRDQRFVARALPIDPPYFANGKNHTWAVCRIKISDDHSLESVGGTYYCTDQQASEECAAQLKQYYEKAVLPRLSRPMPVQATQEEEFKVSTLATMYVTNPANR